MNGPIFCSFIKNSGEQFNPIPEAKGSKFLLNAKRKINKPGSSAKICLTLFVNEILSPVLNSPF